MMKKYIYAVKILISILKNTNNKEINNDNYINRINEIIGMQGLTLLAINQVGSQQFNRLCREHREDIENNKNGSIKFKIIELLYNRMILLKP